VSAFLAGLTGPALVPIPSPYGLNRPSHADRALLASASGDCSTAVSRLACSDQGTPVCLSALTPKIFSHKLPACVMMPRNFHINPPNKGLILTFTAERPGRLYRLMSI
jgi:hypothetical protein